MPHIKKSVLDIIREEVDESPNKKKCENCDAEANESGFCGNCEAKERASQVDEDFGGGIDATRQVTPSNPDKNGKCDRCGHPASADRIGKACKQFKCNGTIRSKPSKPIKESTEDTASLENLLKLAEGVHTRNDPEEVRSFLKNRGDSLEGYILMLHRKLDDLS